MTGARRLYVACLALLVLLFAALGFGLIPGAWIEGVHISYTLPPLRAAIGGITAVAPFSIAECLIACALFVLVRALVELTARLARRSRPRAERPPLRWTRRALNLGLVLGWLYMLGHGLGLARPALAERMELARVPENTRRDAYRDMTLDVARLARQARARWQAEGGKTPSFAEISALAREALISALPDLRERSVLPPGPIKPCLPGGLLMRFGVSGVFSPFTFEAHVDPALPLPTLPFVAAHELAHVAGFASEDEANFVAWLACSRSPAPLLRAFRRLQLRQADASLARGLGTGGTARPKDRARDLGQAPLSTPEQSSEVCLGLRAIGTGHSQGRRELRRNGRTHAGLEGSGAIATREGQAASAREK